VFDSSRQGQPEIRSQSMWITGSTSSSVVSGLAV
jgi:hypothetical protein